MGTTLTLDAKYGITAIKDVLWRADSETVMLAGDGDDCMILTIRIPCQTIKPDISAILFA